MNERRLDMSLQSIAGRAGVVDDASVLESVSDEVCAQILSVALESTCSDDELDELEESYITSGAVTEGVEVTPVLERSIVKLDKNAKKQQAYKMAILHVAKDMGLKEYKQWCTLKKMDIILMRIMEKRCAMKAKAYMREAAKKADKSKKPQFKKASSLLTRSQRNTQKAMSGNHVIPSGLKSAANSIANKLKSK